LDTDDVAQPVESDQAAEICGNVIMAIHRSGSAVPIIREMKARVGEMVRKHPSGIGLMLILRRGAKPPEGRVRQDLAAMFTEHKKALCATSVVVEGSGFWAAAIRSTLTFLSVASSYPLKVFSSIDGAVSWQIAALTKAGASTPSAAELTTVAARLRG
jgi:hypothetical protein